MSFCRLGRILTGKKLQRLQKVRIWAFGSLLHQIRSLQEVLELKQNFQKKKVITGKTPFFAKDPFLLTILIILTLASDMAVLYGNHTFSSLKA